MSGKTKTKGKKESHRYWLTFKAKQMRKPLLWEMSRKHDLVFDIRSANVTAEVGLMALELTGDPKVIEAAVKWFRRRGVQVDPI
jgi:L-aspartate semialdehyde sulfurtransferase ferredoxin